MPRKTFKLGEHAIGGIIAVECDNRKLLIIGKEWDYSTGSNRGSDQSNAKEFTRLEIVHEENTYRKMYDFLSELTTHYYTEMIISWIYSKNSFKKFLD